MTVGQDRPTIGLVGLGHMGGAMATRLLAAGYPVVGTRRSQLAGGDLVAEGLRWEDTPRAVTEAADVLITSLPDDGVLDAVASGPEGILDGLTERTTWLEMSTVSPPVSLELATEVRARSASMLDAPVSGSVPQARAGTLTIMVGGAREAYARAEPVLRQLGSPTHVGANGQGLVLNLAVNISLAVQMLAFAEGLLLATRSGIDRDVALGVMTRTAIGSPMLKARAALVFASPQETWFSLGLMQKDVELARDVAQHLGVPVPTADRADEVLGLARTLGYQDRDLAALFQVLEQETPGQGNAA